MYRRVCISLISLLIFSVLSFAAVDEREETLLISLNRQQLVAEQTRSELLAKKLQDLRNQQEKFSLAPNRTALEHLNFMIAMVKADLNNINLSLKMTQQSTELLQDSIRNTNDQWGMSVRFGTATSEEVQKQRVRLQQFLQEQRSLLDLQERRISVLQKTHNVLRQTLNTVEEWRRDLARRYQLQQQRERQESLDRLETRLEEEQQERMMQLRRWSEELKKITLSGFSNNESYNQSEFNVLLSEEKSNLLENELNVAKISNSLRDLPSTYNQKLSLNTLSNLRHQIENLSEQIQTKNELLQKKLEFFKAYKAIISKKIQESGSKFSEQAQLSPLNDIIFGYQNLFHKVKQLSKEAEAQQGLIAKQLKLQLANRQELPGWSLNAWFRLGKTISQVPTLTVNKLANLSESVASKLVLVSAWQWVVIFLSILVWVVAWLKLRQFLAVDRVRLQQRSRGFFSAQTVIVVLQLLQRHVSGIMLLAGSVGLLFLLNIPIKLFSLIISMGLVCLIFSIVIQLAHILLLENTTDESGHDVKLYYRLRTTLLIGGIITLATILISQLPVNYEVQDLFGRLFMLFLLIVALVLMKGWEVVPTLLEPYIENKHAYLKRIVRWLSFLIPFSLLSNALIGLVGYVELAWAIAHYQGLFLVALTAYLLLRGLLDELVRWASEQCIRHFRNGWLWSQAVLKPFHQILKLALLIVSIMALFALYGWGDRVPLINTSLEKLLSVKLFVIASAATVTGLTVVQLSILIVILIWVAHWSREFAYRWLFVHTKDLGLRNSLAIFTQYTLIAVGITIGLNILGLNWSNISVILGLFSLGVGLGLRDLFNNFFTGIFLLLERPVKVGDWVTIGKYDGQVSHIGARSITVTTNDRQSLLVPNADIFSKNFINWTHRDSLVRSLVNIKVNRKDNPQQIKDIILEVLEKVPKVLKKPQPEVYFTDIDQMLLEFRVEYYVDLSHISSRSEVRSQFLFDLWERFKSEEILPPDTPYDIHLKGKLDIDSYSKT